MNKTKKNLCQIKPYVLQTANVVAPAGEASATNVMTAFTST